MNKRLLLPTLALWLFASAALAGDFVIVPGRRIGSVTLGMSRPRAWAILHDPDTERRTHGLVIDTWLGHQLLTTDLNGIKGLKRDYLTVFFRQGKALQIEASAARFRTAAGLSTGSSSDSFAQRYPNYRTPHFARTKAYYWNGDHFSINAYDPTDSSPACKHFVEYGDAVQQGIAWKNGAWGCLAPEPDPSEQEAIVVHVPGRMVLLNPNDARPYSGTAPARHEQRWHVNSHETLSRTGTKDARTRHDQSARLEHGGTLL